MSMISDSNNQFVTSVAGSQSNQSLQCIQQPQQQQTMQIIQINGVPNDQQQNQQCILQSQQQHSACSNDNQQAASLHAQFNGIPDTNLQYIQQVNGGSQLHIIQPQFNGQPDQNVNQSQSAQQQQQQQLIQCQVTDSLQQCYTTAATSPLNGTPIYQIPTHNACPSTNHSAPHQDLSGSVVVSSHAHPIPVSLDAQQVLINTSAGLMLSDPSHLQQQVYVSSIDALSSNNSLQQPSLITLQSADSQLATVSTSISAPSSNNVIFVSQPTINSETNISEVMSTSDLTTTSSSPHQSIATSAPAAASSTTTTTTSSSSISSSNHLEETIMECIKSATDPNKPVLPPRINSSFYTGVKTEDSQLLLQQQQSLAAKQQKAKAVPERTPRTPQDLSKLKCNTCSNPRMNCICKPQNGEVEDECVVGELPDYLKENLDIVVVGINPSITTAHIGHHYSEPGNHFWSCVSESGLVPRPVTCYDDANMLDYGIGFTNVCTRPTKGASELTRKEMKEGARILLEKVQKYTPKIAVFNGKGIYQAFVGHKNFYMGKQPKPLPDTNTIIFVMPSSSARCAQLPRAADKLPFFYSLKKLVEHLNGQRPDLDESDVIFPDYAGLRVSQPDPKSLLKAERRRKRKLEQAKEAEAVNAGEIGGGIASTQSIANAGGTVMLQGQQVLLDPSKLQASKQNTAIVVGQAGQAATGQVTPNMLAQAMSSANILAYQIPMPQETKPQSAMVVTTTSSSSTKKSNSRKKKKVGNDNTAIDGIQRQVVSTAVPAGGNAVSTVLQAVAAPTVIPLQTVTMTPGAGGQQQWAAGQATPQLIHASQPTGPVYAAEPVTYSNSGTTATIFQQPIYYQQYDGMLHSYGTARYITPAGAHTFMATPQPYICLQGPRAALPTSTATAYATGSTADMTTAAALLTTPQTANFTSLLMQGSEIVQQPNQQPVSDDQQQQNQANQQGQGDQMRSTAQTIFQPQTILGPIPPHMTIQQPINIKRENTGTVVSAGIAQSQQQEDLKKLLPSNRPATDQEKRIYMAL